MTKHYFERTPASSGNPEIKIDELSLPISDCIKLLQVILKKKEAYNAQTLYNNMLNHAKATLRETISNGIKEVVDPLFAKIVIFFSTLIDMDNGDPLEQINWERVEESLVDFDAEVQRLFKQYRLTIATFQFALILLLQYFLADPRTKEQVPAGFEMRSIRPLLYHVMLIEYAECGITTPTKTIVQETKFITRHQGELEKSIHALALLERNKLSPDHETFQYFQDLAYVQILQHEAAYFPNPGNAICWQKYALSQLNLEELAALAHQLGRYQQKDTGQDQRTTLQLLAVLDALYFGITKSNLSDRDLLAILLALQQSKFELQWQLDMYQTSAPALLLYIAVLCLQGDVVHVEQAQRLLNLTDAEASHRIFLQKLQIVYSERSEPMYSNVGVFHFKNPKQTPHTYYFGSQFIRFSDNLALNHYLAQALLEIKQSVLQWFDVWYVVLNPKNTIHADLDQERRTLLHTVEQVWTQHMKQVSRCQQLCDIDVLIEAFQNNRLLEIWQATEQRLLAYTRPHMKAKITALQQQFEAIWQRIRTKYYACYATALSTLQHHTGEVAQYAPYARYHYEHGYWSEEEFSHWLNVLLRKHTQQLRHLCPTVQPVANADEQLQLVMQFLAALPKDQVVAAENIAAIILALNVCHGMNTLLPWFSDAATQENMTQLGQISSSMVVQTLAQNVVTALRWSNETEGYYYRWFESPTMSQAAKKVCDMAQSLADDPGHPGKLSIFVQNLLEQQQILNQQSWYFPWAWLFGYRDTRDVLKTTLSQIEHAITLQHIAPNVLATARESAYCAAVLQRMHAAIALIQLDSNKSQEWKQVLQTLEKLQKTQTGYALLGEVHNYLETQRKKFVLKQQSYFYGPREYDPIDPLLQVLEQGLSSLGKTPYSIWRSREFLSKKSHQIKSNYSAISQVTIQCGYYKEPYFDVWITSEHAIADLSPDPKKPNTWFKRFYAAKEFFAFARNVVPKNEAVADTHVTLLNGV